MYYIEDGSGNHIELKDLKIMGECENCGKEYHVNMKSITIFGQPTFDGSVSFCTECDDMLMKLDDYVFNTVFANKGTVLKKGRAVFIKEESGEVTALGKFMKRYGGQDDFGQNKR